MAAGHGTTTDPATPSHAALADSLACALLWVDVAAISLHDGEQRRTAHALTHARLQLRAAVRRLRGPRDR